jgi:acetoacetyl-CoA synthetase
VVKGGIQTAWPVSATIGADTLFPWRAPFVELTPRGTARMLGRSDGTLNVRGVRIGAAELYAILQGMPEISDCMALEQRAPQELGGSRLVLLVVLVVLAPGRQLDRPLVLRMKKAGLLHDRGSPNHVPAVVAQVQGLPTTFSGKKSEVAATDAVHGREVTNRSALRNPETLAEIATHPDLLPRG